MINQTIMVKLTPNSQGFKTYPLLYHFLFNQTFSFWSKNFEGISKIDFPVFPGMRFDVNLQQHQTAYNSETQAKFFFGTEFFLLLSLCMSASFDCVVEVILTRNYYTSHPRLTARKVSSFLANLQNSYSKRKSVANKFRHHWKRIIQNPVNVSPKIASVFTL